MNHYIPTLSTLLLLLCLTFGAHAQEAEENDTPSINRTNFGVGFQGTFPANGISGIYDISNRLSAQAILGFFGTLNTYAARGIYRFQNERDWNIYGYGMAGAWTYSGVFQNETVPGFGAGAGIEYDWRAFNRDLPPLFFNLELGFGSASFSQVNYNFSSFLFGGGIHYRF